MENLSPDKQLMEFWNALKNNNEFGAFSELFLVPIVKEEGHLIIDIKKLDAENNKVNELTNFLLGTDIVNGKVVEHNLTIKVLTKGAIAPLEIYIPMYKGLSKLIWRTKGSEEKGILRFDIEIYKDLFFIIMFVISLMPKTFDYIKNRFTIYKQEEETTRKTKASTFFNSF